MQLLSDPKAWIAFFALTVLEIVLGIDNIVLVSLLADRVPPNKRRLAGRSGLVLAMFGRIGLLLLLTYALGFNTPLISLPTLGFGGQPFLPAISLSIKDIIVIAGGLFLLAKASNDIHDNLDGGGELPADQSKEALGVVIVQMFLLNTLFSLDSVMTAVGMADHVEVMIAAVVVATGLMLTYAKYVAKYVRSHPTTKMLALAFIVLIAVNLVAEGFHYSIPKGYTYFAMLFAVGVEMLNGRARNRRRELNLARASKASAAR